MAEHTPEPWAAEREGDLADLVPQRSRSGSAVLVRAEFGASAWPCYPAVALGHDLVEARANAHLIAAAPDQNERLVATNKAIREFLDSKQYGTERAWEAILDANDAVLAKAKGEVSRV